MEGGWHSGPLDVACALVQQGCRGESSVKRCGLRGTLNIYRDRGEDGAAASLIGRGARHTCVGVQPATSWFRDDVDVVTLKHNPAHVGQIAQVPPARQPNADQIHVFAS
jgi:hypothetical protein